MSIKHRIANRVERAISATPDWVFVFGPRLVCQFVVGAGVMAGTLWLLQAATGVSTNPISATNNLLEIMRSRH